MGGLCYSDLRILERRNRKKAKRVKAYPNLTKVGDIFPVCFGPRIDGVKLTLSIFDRRSSIPYGDEYRDRKVIRWLKGAKLTALGQLG